MCVSVIWVVRVFKIYEESNSSEETNVFIRRRRNFKGKMFYNMMFVTYEYNE